MPQAGNCGYGFVYETFTSDIPNDVTAPFSRVQCNYGAFLRPVYSTYFREIPADTAGEFFRDFPIRAQRSQVNKEQCYRLYLNKSHTRHSISLHRQAQARQPRLKERLAHHVRRLLRPAHRMISPQVLIPTKLLKPHQRSRIPTRVPFRILPTHRHLIQPRPRGPLAVSHDPTVLL